MSAPCGCCGGTEAITPVSTANRPGLPSLVYRAGTHGSFLETMKARLSSTDFPALAALTTREGDDPAIALLDAWATVSDVLTFYQERIANEGYLRTATERRSVLELARLIGYRIRPGVASTLYLAYTLEKGSRVTIPAGARVQSIPGPGELPQSFETSEKLDARADWNLLGIRRTQPQLPKPEDLDAGGALHFAGTSTNLKPNDPLLVDFGARQEVYRVMAVAPDAVANRTAVAVQSWLPAVQKAAATTLELLDRLSDVDSFKVSAGSQVAKRVLGHLDELRSRVTPSMSAAELQSLLGEEFDAKLLVEEEAAMKSRSTRAAPWISTIRTQLTGVTNNGMMPGPCESVASQGPGTTARLTDLLTALSRPPSIPPANSLRLGRSVTGALAAGSDVAPQLLTSLRPELAGTLYGTWGKVPVTPPPPIAVYALRTRASVFGHNAPLKSLTNDAGAVTGHQEWTLSRDTGGKRDQFSIEVNFISRGTGVPGIAINNPGINITATVTVNGQTGTVTQPLATGQFTIPVPGLSAPVTASVTLQESGGTLMTFTIEKPKIAVLLLANAAKGIFDAASQGSNPTTFLTVSGSAQSEGTLLTMTVNGTSSDSGATPTEEPAMVSLDASYPAITPCSWVVLERPFPLTPDPTVPDPTASPLIIGRAMTVGERSRSDYGISAKGTRIGLDKEWIDPATDNYQVIRETAIFTQSEALPLAETPIESPLCGDQIELDGLYDGLQTGRWVIVSGERADVTADATRYDIDIEGEMADDQVKVSGIPAQELAMIASVEQSFDPNLPGDRTHTRIRLSTSLGYCYRRETLTIYGNVVKATHGETRSEVLGAGDGSRGLQSFTLRQPPLTYVAAPTTSGITSTLQIRVNDLLWHETESILDLGPNDHGFTTRTDDNDNVTVIFGDGRQGSRLPTGRENVRATYRNGIGKAGNVGAGQVTMLATRPLGVKEVINPLRASGGADRESRDQARSNAPLAVMALDRLVSVQDYADFARTFAGIGKASAVRLSDGRQQLVHLTIAGADDIPIDRTSDLYRNLSLALLKYGDPYQAVRIELRQLLLLVIGAGVRVHPDYQWETVEPLIRAALLDALSFERRGLGQDALLSEAISVIQKVPGVLYVDVDTFDALDERVVTASLGSGKGLTTRLRSRIPVLMAGEAASRASSGVIQSIDSTKANSIELIGDPGAGRISAKSSAIRPAQIAILSPDVRDTLILTELQA